MRRWRSCARARNNAADYFAPLLTSANEVLQIGAWTALLERNELTYAQYPELVALADANPGIRRRAFRHFMTWCDYDFAQRLLTLTPPGEDELETQLMGAELRADPEATVVAQRALYLASGRPELLSGLIGVTERAAGWRAALPVAVDQAALNPHDPMAMLQLLGLVQQARQADLIAAIVALLEETGLHPGPALLYRAVIMGLKGEWAGCLKTLGQVGTLRIPRPDVVASMRVTATALQAEALEKTRRLS